MNILWIEDFGGLPAGKNILNQMFSSLLNFDAWDNEVLSLISNPADLTEFCKKQKSLHTIYLCRNYFDYAEFKQLNNIINEIDAVILDIRLDNGIHVDFSLEIPKPHENKAEFHKNAGFYIFNDLVHLGVSVEKMCFMTGEDTSFTEFQRKCTEIYLPQIECFQKGDKGCNDLKTRFLNPQETDYTKLRRGIIEGCRYLKTLSKKELRFNDFTTNEKTVELDEMQDYLTVLENFLPLREPTDKAALYKLFVRTLAHEWEAAEPKEIKGLAWIMKSTRNWITHNSALFSELDEQMVAYLFLINSRVMFSFDESVQPYEKILHSLFPSDDVLSEQLFKDKSKNKLIPVSSAYLELKNVILDERDKQDELCKKDRNHKRITIKDAFDFGELANNIQLSKSLIANDKDLFKKLLYQIFWLSTSNPYISTKKDKRNLLEIKFWDFDYTEKIYLFELARHIYSRSFTEN